jgi:hypothetical protein
MSNQQQDITKFEFLLTLDGNIICQRFFNVKDHVDQARRSMDIHYYVKNICDDIAEDLKIKSSDYLSENANYFLSSGYVEDSIEKDREHFLLEIKLNESVFIQRIFPAYYYHPKVRYTVDIRPKLKRILSDLTDILSSEDLETTYLNYQL